MTLLSLLFSGLGISLIAAGLIAAAVVAFVRGWTHVAIGLAIIAGAHVWSGSIYQAGEAACQARVAAAVKAEQERQAKVVAAAVAASEARVAAAELLAAEKEEEVAAYVAELNQMADSACLLDDADARRLQQLLR